MRDSEVLIIGGGLSGLACARRLQEVGISFQLLEAGDTLGGRVQTDLLEGFLLDRGFQVLLTAYPEAQRVLDYSALELKPFYPGSLVRSGGGFHRLADPWRHPLDGFKTAFTPVGNLLDKIHVGRLRQKALAGAVDDLFTQPPSSTKEALIRFGFSDAMIAQFFRPFLGGVFLEEKLETSSKMLAFVFRMFALGDTALPARGMGEIPRQLSQALPPECVRTGARVASLEPHGVILTSGEEIQAEVVIVATEGPEAHRLVSDLPTSGSRSVTCLYFAAEKPPMEEPMLVLNGDERGPINNLVIPSNVAPGYAPSGASLISVSVLGDAPDALGDVTSQLKLWFGNAVAQWRHLRTYRIRHALPGRTAALDASFPVIPRHRPGLYLCGDYQETPSIEGALTSGRRTAEAVLQDHPALSVG